MDIGDIGILVLTIVIVIITVTLCVFGIMAVLTTINIDNGPYKCVDIDGNEIICEQTWRSNGTLYGITEDGKTIDLKSYESIEEE